MGWNPSPGIKTASLPAAWHVAPLGFPNATFQMDHMEEQRCDVMLGSEISTISVVAPPPPPFFLAHCDVMMVSVCALTWQIIPDFTVKHVWGHLLLSVPLVLLMFVEMWAKRRAAALSQAVLYLQGGKPKNIYAKKHVFSAAWFMAIQFNLIICIKMLNAKGDCS